MPNPAVVDSAGVFGGQDAYRTLFDESPCPMVVQNADLRVVEVNRALCKLLGYPRETLIGIDPLDKMMDVTRPAVLREREALVNDAEPPPHFLRRLHCSDGRVVVCRLYVKPLKQGDHLQGYISTLFELDTGDSGQRERHIWSDRFQRLFDQAPVGLVVTEPDGQVRRANREFKRLIGMTQEELRALGPIFVAPTGAPGAVGVVETRELSASTHFRELWQRADGQTLWLDRVTQVVEAIDGSVVHFTVVANVTREMQAYSQLQSAMNEYRVLLDATAAGVLKLQRGRIIRANEALEHMFMVRAIDLLGRSPVRAFGSRARYRACLKRAVDAMTRGASFSMECRLFRPDGSAIECELQCRRVIDGDALAGIIVTIHDITELRAQERVRMQAAAAQHKVLVREIHHRIKNNLQGVAGLIQSLAARRPELNEVLSGIAGQIRTMGQVYGLQQIDDLGSLPVSRLVRSIVSSQPSAYSAITFSCDRDGDEASDWRLPEQEVIPFALIVNELLTNAFKHGASNPDVQVDLCCSDAGCVLLISNLPAAGADALSSSASSLDSGLGLVRAMLPSRHAKLDLSRENSRVIARLEIRSPALTRVTAAAPPAAA